MGKYFVYFSATGNGDYIADLYEKAGYKPVKIEMKEPMGKMGFFTILKYGGKAMIGAKAEIIEPETVPGEDDEVIVGSPIWNDRLSTPINTVLSRYPFNKETTGFVLYPAGDRTKKSLRQIADLGYEKTPVVVQYPLKYREEAARRLGL